MSDKKLTREEAHALFDDMQRAMQSRLDKKTETAGVTNSRSQKAAPSVQVPTSAAAKVAAKAAYENNTSANAIKAAARSPQLKSTTWSKRSSGSLGGQGMALMLIAFLGCAKITLSAIEYTGIARIEEAKAVVTRAPSGPQWTKEQSKILTALDSRRVELEERSGRLDKREGDLVAKERELAVRLTELKDLTERLKIEREKGDKQKSAQLDQLSNVYGSMNPPEAAHLLEQLDVQVALSLVERMPEKRMAQILALMNAQRALELTNLLSNRVRS
jgi:flagellar motility protein MotE (MotC chaperone)